MIYERSPDADPPWGGATRAFPHHVRSLDGAKRACCYNALYTSRVSCALLSRASHLPSIDSERQTAGTDMRRPGGVWRPRMGRIGRAISLATPTHLNMAAIASHALPVPH
eukprot:3027192-Prymnesium_polylepis.1